MTREEIFDRIRSAFADAGLSPSEGELTLGTNYAQLIGDVSVRVTALALALGREFGIEIPDEDITEFETVDDLVGYISGRLVP